MAQLAKQGSANSMASDENAAFFLQSELDVEKMAHTFASPKKAPPVLSINTDALTQQFANVWKGLSQQEHKLDHSYSNISTIFERLEQSDKMVKKLTDELETMKKELKERPALADDTLSDDDGMVMKGDEGNQESQSEAPTTAAESARTQTSEDTAGAKNGPNWFDKGESGGVKALQNFAEIARLSKNMLNIRNGFKKTLIRRQGEMQKKIKGGISLKNAKIIAEKVVAEKLDEYSEELERLFDHWNENQKEDVNGLKRKSAALERRLDDVYTELGTRLSDSDMKRRMETLQSLADRVIEATRRHDEKTPVKAITKACYGESPREDDWLEAATELAGLVGKVKAILPTEVAISLESSSKKFLGDIENTYEALGPAKLMGQPLNLSHSMMMAVYESFSQNLHQMVRVAIGNSEQAVVEQRDVNDKYISNAVKFCRRILDKASECATVYDGIGCQTVMFDIHTNARQLKRVNDLFAEMRTTNNLAVNEFKLRAKVGFDKVFTNVDKAYERLVEIMRVPSTPMGEQRSAVVEFDWRLMNAIVYVLIQAHHIFNIGVQGMVGARKAQMDYKAEVTKLVDSQTSFKEQLQRQSVEISSVWDLVSQMEDDYGGGPTRKRGGGASPEVLEAIKAQLSTVQDECTEMTKAVESRLESLIEKTVEKTTYKTDLDEIHSVLITKASYEENKQEHEDLKKHTWKELERLKAELPHFLGLELLAKKKDLQALRAAMMETMESRDKATRNENKKELDRTSKQVTDRVLAVEDAFLRETAEIKMTIEQMPTKQDLETIVNESETTQRVDLVSDSLAELAKVVQAKADIDMVRAALAEKGDANELEQKADISYCNELFDRFRKAVETLGQEIDKTKLDKGHMQAIDLGLQLLRLQVTEKVDRTDMARFEKDVLKGSVLTGAANVAAAAAKVAENAAVVTDPVPVHGRSAITAQARPNSAAPGSGSGSGLGGLVRTPTTTGRASAPRLNPGDPTLMCGRDGQVYRGRVSRPATASPTLSVGRGHHLPKVSRNSIE